MKKQKIKSLKIESLLNKLIEEEHKKYLEQVKAFPEIIQLNLQCFEITDKAGNLLNLIKKSDVEYICQMYIDVINMLKS